MFEALANPMFMLIATSLTAAFVYYRIKYHKIIKQN